MHDDYTHFECTYDDSGVYEELHLVIYESNEVHYGTWSHEQDDALKRRLFRFFDEVLTKELDQERFIELHLINDENSDAWTLNNTSYIVFKRHFAYSPENGAIRREIPLNVEEIPAVGAVQMNE